ncbi:hypothetical protein ACHAQJ_008108 [Trichoderma viride]
MARQCDGTRPSCEQCVSAKHECPGYNDDWKFINNGAKLPHKRQKRQSSRSTRIRPTDTSAYTAEKNIEMQADATIEVRHASTSLANRRTESLDISPLDFPKATETALKSLDSPISLPVELCFDLGDNNVSEVGVGGLQPPHFQTSGPAPETSPGLMSSASNSEFEMGLAALASEFMLESEQEIVFLLRHYTDNLAPCLRSTLALTEIYPSAGHVDWAFKAANYYHQAATNSQQQSPLYDTVESALHGTSSSAFMDVAAASNAILTVYEMIDSNHDEFHT